ncbi:MAG: IS3 family transposase [Phascolarctobacterium sp.]|nr:IS3 family transposase [Phascolarctobacterium sp.]
MSESLEIDFVLETVRLAMDRHGLSFSTETLIHSDRGSHYTSKKFIQIVNDSKLRRSMSRRGNCWDNAPQESFFGHMRQETYFERCRTVKELKAAIDDWMDYYNNDRYQESLAKLSPNEYYEYIKTGIYPLKI